MKPLEYQVRFTTPAFLGNAEQNGQWRTPPFKALLRQWWRVAWAADHSFRVNLADMRREEGLLFGNAWLSHRENDREVPDHRKSLVRIRLDRWDEGKLRSWQGLEQGTVFHPEVQRTNYRVGPHAYLAYGALDGRGGTQFDSKRNAAIQAGEEAKLSIAVPEEHAPRLQRALWLMDRYGTLGGRSRNGWGSCVLLPLPPGEGRGEGAAIADRMPLRLWSDCLNLDWPHAIGRDEQGPLIWQTQPQTDWKTMMKTLAIIKIGLRTQFVFPNVAPPHRGIEERHWLSYPITKHVTNAWPRGARLPNQLRFKVRPTSEGKLVGVIFHVPHLPPPEFAPVPAAIERTWQKVHALLDELRKPASARTYSMIADASRRAALRTQLDTVALIDKRITE